MTKIRVYDITAIAGLFLTSKIKSSIKEPGVMRNIIKINTVDMTEASLFESVSVGRSPIPVAIPGPPPAPHITIRPPPPPASGPPDMTYFANCFNQWTLLDMSILKENCLRKSYHH